MASDDDPPTRPGRASAQKLFLPHAESRHVADAQSRILDGLRNGIKNLVDHYFDDAKAIIRMAILHATHDVYNEAQARATARAALLFRSYLDVLEHKLGQVAGDPRAEIALPHVTAEELRLALLAHGASLRAAEVRELAGQLKVDLAAPENSV